MGSVYTHISNFIDTWEGWGNLIKGLIKLLDLEKLYPSLPSFK